MMPLPISVSMISGAEANRIGRALESVAGWTEEVVVVLNQEVTDGTEAIAYEDSPNGLYAAKAAGLRCVVVPGPLTADGDYSTADVVVASLADVEPKTLWDFIDAEYS